MRIRYSTRIVALIGRIAIKIPISRRGYLQCKNERRMWEKYRDLGILGRMYWEFAGIVCMQRYSPVDPKSKEEYETFRVSVKKAKRMMREFDIDNCDLYREENWGKLGSEYLLIDYGINEEISKMY